MNLILKRSKADSKAMSKQRSLNNHFNYASGKHSVKIFLVAENRRGELCVLTLIRRDNKKRDLAGGNLNKGETPEKAARREIHEETGYEVDNLIPLSYEGQDETINGKYRHIFIAHAPELFEPELSKEHSDYKWIPLKQFSMGDIHTRTADILRKVGRRDLMRMTRETRAHELELAI